MLMNNKVLCFCTTIYNVNDISYENILIYYSLNVDLLSLCQVGKSRYIFFIKPENTRLVVCQKKLYQVCPTFSISLQKTTP